MVRPQVKVEKSQVSLCPCLRTTLGTLQSLSSRGMMLFRLHSKCADGFALMMHVKRCWTIEIVLGMLGRRGEHTSA